MAKQKSDIVSGMGTGFEIIKRLSDAVAAASGGEDDLRRILSDPTLPPRLAAEIMTTVKATYATCGAYVFRKTDWPCGARILHLGMYNLCRDVSVRAVMDLPGFSWQGQRIEASAFQPNKDDLSVVKLGLLSAGDARSGRQILDLMDRLMVRNASALDLVAVMQRYPDLMEPDSGIAEILALAVEYVDTDETYVFGAQRSAFFPASWLRPGRKLEDMGWGKIVWFLVKLSE